MLSPVAAAFLALSKSDPAAGIAWTAAGPRSRADLVAAADRFTALLGSVPDDARVAVSVRDGFGFLAAVLAVWRRGGCVVMLDAADPRAPRRDLARRFGAAAIVVDEPEWQALPVGGGDAANGLAAIKLTSGSTGEPRGIGVTAAALVADADALHATMGIRADDRIVAAVPMSFSYGIGSVLVPALWRGQPIVIPDHRHPLGVLHALRLGAPTVLPAVPALLRALLASRADVAPRLRLVVSAGALLPPAIAVAFRARFGSPVHAFYGCTEAGGICYDRAGTSAENGSVGTPVDGVRVSLDGDGRVVVQSPAVGRALVADPDLRDGTFVLSDVATFRGAELVLLGRVDDVIDVGGHKVHPREVERVIAALAGVDDVAVVPWQDDDGRAVCTALVVAGAATGGPPIDEAAVRRHCLLHLPPAKVPRRIVFAGELPRTGRGKLSRDDVQRAIAAHAGGDGRPA